MERKYLRFGYVGVPEFDRHTKELVGHRLDPDHREWLAEHYGYPYRHYRPPNVPGDSGEPTTLNLRWHGGRVAVLTVTLPGDGNRPDLPVSLYLGGQQTRKGGPVSLAPVDMREVPSL